MSVNPELVDSAGNVKLGMDMNVRWLVQVHFAMYIICDKSQPLQKP